MLWSSNATSVVTTEGKFGAFFLGWWDCRNRQADVSRRGAIRIVLLAKFGVDSRKFDERIDSFLAVKLCVFPPEELFDHLLEAVGFLEDCMQLDEAIFVLHAGTVLQLALVHSHEDHVAFSVVHEIEASLRSGMAINHRGVFAAQRDDVDGRVEVVDELGVAELLPA